MRPPNHMPCSPDEATVAVLGDARFNRNVYGTWTETMTSTWHTLSALTRYGASFYKPVPNPPENTRELTEEEMASTSLRCYILNSRFEWVLDT